MNESLFCAKEKLCDSVLISYSDIIFEKKILDQLQNFKGDIGVAVRLNWKSSYNGRTLHSKIEAENILLENGKILKTQKNISEELPNQTVAEFLGLIKLSKVGCSIFLEKFSELKKSHTGKFHSSPSLKQAYLTDMLQELIDTGYTVEPVLVNGNWCEIDTIQDIENARKNFRL
jgi:choline kinase